MRTARHGWLVVPVIVIVVAATAVVETVKVVGWLVGTAHGAGTIIMHGATEAISHNVSRYGHKRSLDTVSQ